MDKPTPNARLHPWTLSHAPEPADAECSHCGAPFMARDGMVTEDFSLCPACDARD